MRFRVGQTLSDDGARDRSRKRGPQRERAHALVVFATRPGVAEQVGASSGREPQIAGEIRLCACELILLRGAVAREKRKAGRGEIERGRPGALVGERRREWTIRDRRKQGESPRESVADRF